jgi:hypothetical protein
MQVIRLKAKSLPMLLAVASLSVGVTACGGTGKSTSSDAHASSDTGSATTSASTTPTHPPAESNADDKVHDQPAGEPDKREITQLVNRYYAAAADDDGAKACSLLFSSIAASVPEDYGQAPGPLDIRGKTCAVVMSKLFKHVHGQSSADLATTKVTEVRINSEDGVVQLSSRGMPKGEIIVEREGHGWKVAVLIGSRPRP